MLRVGACAVCPAWSGVVNETAPLMVVNRGAARISMNVMIGYVRRDMVLDIDPSGWLHLKDECDLRMGEYGWSLLPKFIAAINDQQMAGGIKAL